MAFGGDSSSYARSGCSLEKFKLTAVAWDSDKDPGGYHLWIENFGSMVRATEHGSLLEDMLDSKLGRVKVAKSGAHGYNCYLQAGCLVGSVRFKFPNASYIIHFNIATAARGSY